MRNVWRIFGRDELRVKFLAWNMKAAFFAVDRGAACESGRKVAIIFRRNIVAVFDVVEVVEAQELDEAEDIVGEKAEEQTEE